jgi:hypothetical protein
MSSLDMEEAVLLMEFAKADRHEVTESETADGNCSDAKLPAHSSPGEQSPLEHGNKDFEQTLNSERKINEKDQAQNHERSSLKVNR